jgi:hypothetical protein
MDYCTRAGRPRIMGQLLVYVFASGLGCVVGILTPAPLLVLFQATAGPGCVAERGVEVRFGLGGYRDYVDA